MISFGSGANVLSNLPAAGWAVGGDELPKTLRRSSTDRGWVRDGAQRTRVLIVDDERIIADTLTTILNLSGFEAFAAYSGEDALETLCEHCPDIVLTDVRMPGRNGIETGKEIRRRCPAVRVVLFSGQAGVSSMIEQARGDGPGFELWSKPLHPRELVRRLRSF